MNDRQFEEFIEEMRKINKNLHFIKEQINSISTGATIIVLMVFVPMFFGILGFLL
jgi:hypothetical protein